MTLGPLCTVLRRSRGLSWLVLGRSRGLCGVLGCLRGNIGFWDWSWGLLGGLGLLPGPMFVVLGRLGAFVGCPAPSWARSSGPCWRSWAALGAYVGGLGPKSGPGSSGKAVW